MTDHSWTESVDFDDEIDYEDYSDNGESAEFFPPGLGVPSVGAAVANRLLHGRGRRPLPTPKGRGYVPPPSGTRPLPATQQQLGVATSRIAEDVRKMNASIKALEGRLDTYSTQLAGLQQRRAGRQSGDLLKYALTNAISSGVKDWVTHRDDEKLKWLAFTNTAPLLQAAISAGGAGMSSAIQRTPASTAIFPIAGGILPFVIQWLLKQKETIGTVTVDPPILQLPPNANDKFNIVARDPGGKIIPGRKFKFYSTDARVIVDDNGNVQVAAAVPANTQVDLIAVDEASNMRGSARLVVT